MLADRVGGRGLAGRLRAHAAALRLASGILIGARRARDRVQPGHALPDRAARLHRGAPEARRGERRPPSASSRSCRGGTAKPLVANEADDGSTPGLPDYGLAPALAQDRPLVQLAAADAEEAARQGRAARLLDVLVHQLPAHAAAPRVVVRRRTARAGLVDPRRAHARVRVRARHLERRRGGQAARRSSYPVVQDNDYGTWDAYSNQYWPAEYLIDRSGHIRHVHFGESSYGETESLIRQLLGDDGAMAKSAARTRRRPSSTTPESYLGYERLDALRGLADPAGRRWRPTRSRSRLPQNDIAYAGEWRVEDAADRRRRRTRACGCTTSPSTCTSSSAARARSTCS